MASVVKDGLRRILNDRGGVLKGASVPEALTPEVLCEVHELMLRQRLLDDLMLTKQRQGQVGFYGAATGQEAAVFGTGLALNPEDWILPALREGGIALMRGYPLEDYLAQCFGNALDKTFGRQMPCHYGARAQNYATLSSPIGNQLPQAVGVAMGMKIRGERAVAVGFIGDGGTSENDFHTALDMASRLTVPAVFVCQNNQWAISTPVAGQTSAKTIADKARPFKMPIHRVDGNDILACYEVAQEAFEFARQGGGPSFIEALTYRVGAHSTSDDPSRYRDESITEKWKKRCPIERFERFLVARGLLTTEALEALRVRLAAEIRETMTAVQLADPAPPLASMFDDVYAERTWVLEEQLAEAEQYGVPRTH